ncbi:hypothetical protein [Sedimentibacter sp.]|uniref:hypothetical protein n=1 Tax=Sedimentibacter sp. TaxID=1960295 RepID=UPI0028A8E62F|nr:hypothetical protein [Sedimentibacter sp.]
MVWINNGNGLSGKSGANFMLLGLPVFLLKSLISLLSLPAINSDDLLRWRFDIEISIED